MSRKRPCGCRNYYYKIQERQKGINHLIRRMAHWEMSQSLLTAPDMSWHLNSAGVFLLEMAIILYLVGVKLPVTRKKNRKPCQLASRRDLVCSDQLKFRTWFPLLFKYIQNNEFLCMIDNNYLHYSKAEQPIKKKSNWQDNRGARSKAILLAFLPFLLIMAGDVELNPGPYSPELLRNLMRDLVSLAPMNQQFGIQLCIELCKIKCFVGSPENILADILDYWLNNTPENKQHENLCTALAAIGREDLKVVIQEKYNSVPFKVKFAAPKEEISQSSEKPSDASHLFQSSNNTADAATVNPSKDLIPSPGSCDTELTSQSTKNVIHSIISSNNSTNTSQSSTNTKTLSLTCCKENVVGHHVENESLNSEVVQSVDTGLSARLKQDRIVHINETCTLYYHALESEDIQCKLQLECETKNLRISYSNILDGLYNFLYHTSHAVYKLKYVLRHWLPLEKGEEGSPTQHLEKCEERDPTKHDEERFLILWDIFSKFCSFFNYILLERAINVAEYVNGQQEIKEYKNKLEKYFQRRVTQCPSGMGMKGDNHIVLVIKLDEEYSKSTIGHLSLLGDEICRIIQVEREKMQTEGVEKGCIGVIFHLHKSALPQGEFCLTDRQIEDFKQLRFMEARILSVKFGHVHYIINKTDGGKIGQKRKRKMDDSGEELLANLVEDLCTLAPRNQEFGIQLCIGIHDIKCFTGSAKDIFAQILDHWLNNTPENKQHEKLCKALVAVGRGDLKVIIEEKYNSLPFEAKLDTPIAEIATSSRTQCNTSCTPQSSDNSVDADYNVVGHGIDDEKMPFAKKFCKGHQVTTCNHNLKVENKKTNSPLHVAAENGQVEVVKYLIENLKWDPNIKGHRDFTPLHVASMHGQLHVAKFLIEGLNCNPMVKGQCGWTPLHAACTQSHLDVITYLVCSCHCDPMIRNEHNETPLQIALINGQLETVKYFLENLKCDPNIKDECNSTLLHEASRYGHLDVIKYLIDTHHCDPMIRNDYHNTPLHLAAMNGQLQVVRYFIEDLNCDFETCDSMKSDWTPLHAASEEGHLDVIKYLIDTHHCDPMIRDKNNNTPLHFAVIKGQLHLLKYFIEVLNCDATVEGHWDWTPLHVASQHGNLDVLKYLIDTCHCDPMIRDEDNNTPLHIASLNGHLQLVKYFIEDLKCDPNVKGELNSTPLHGASQNGHLDLIKYLIHTHHCNPMIKNEENHSPLYSASLGGQLQVVKYFTEVLKCDLKF